MMNKEHTDLTAVINVCNLAVSVGANSILNAINLQMSAGTVHALMGRNGSGKSSLAYTLMGYPQYTVTQGQICFLGADLQQCPIDERSRLGLFLAMQNPIAIPGISVYTLLKEAVRARDVAGFSLVEFSKEIEHAADKVQVPRAWLHRSLDSGFSGGEKKRLELLQMLVLKPVCAILDEIDSGLDVDAMLHIGSIVKNYVQENPRAVILVMSHQKKFLDVIEPNQVHIMKQGAISCSGDYSLIDAIEQGGYDVP
jgi:Fe-S cluster assembly ATP-binding protein